MPDVRPDIREVYEMVTKQKPSDPGALERQRTQQIRTMRNRRVGAFVVAAAIVVTAVAVILATRPGDNQTRTGTQGTPTPVEVATGFVEAYGAHDAARAIGYLSHDADISRMMSTIGAQGIEGTPTELSILISWLDAAGNKLTLDACHETTASFVSGTAVSCTYDYTASGPMRSASVRTAAAISFSPSVMTVTSLGRCSIGRPRSSRDRCGNPSPTGCPGTIRRTPR